MSAEVLQAELESGLGKLINLAGKTRMLSHRVAMFALLIAQTQDKRLVLEFDAALDEFERITNALQHGNAGLGISDQVVRLVQQRQAVSPEARADIERFVAEARRLRQALQADRSAESWISFTQFVATDLLSSLNQIADNVGAVLRQYLERRTHEEGQTKQSVREAVASIDAITQRVKLISLNATIEAAHAGEHGKGFNIIATEIRVLSEESARVTRDLMRRLS